LNHSRLLNKRFLFWRKKGDALKKYAVFIDYCDACQDVFDSYERAKEWYDKLVESSNGISVYLCEVILETESKRKEG